MTTTRCINSGAVPDRQDAELPRIALAADLTKESGLRGAPEYIVRSVVRAMDELKVLLIARPTR
ncbi:MAG: hypothetical protein ABJF28_10370 [Nisaea sp.]|uniref:hypothetical protein n=1 Tax=Nisaea sp. TaxID=2024842 RepID=UPI0032632522